jgi:hypothetical protein
MMGTQPSIPALAVTIALGCLLLAARPAAAQSVSPFEIGAQLAIADSNALGGADPGIGVRFGWLASPMFGVEAEVNVFARDLPGDGAAISGSRVEALFGATFGPRYRAFRPFARLRPGFLKIGQAPEPIACILIFPPPLSCTLAGGKTLFALDLGGGIEASTTDRSFVRVDVGDRILRYPGSVIDTEGTVRSQGFTGHDLRIAIGGGYRF